MKRLQQHYIIQDLKKKMVVITGPRQAGKTWLAQNIASTYGNSTYLNYDDQDHRAIIETKAWLHDTELLVLDELHKMPMWKNYLKGVYDTKHKELNILVTGSARLDVYDHMGDSMAGRYFRHRLLPLSLSELHYIGYQATLNDLLARSGFPEPFLEHDEIEVERWRQQYFASLLTTDLLEFGSINHINSMRTILELLRRSVGSPISMQSIARDVKLSPTSVKKYIDILEALYIIFKVTPYSRNIARSILKEPKIYFFDSGMVIGDIGAKIENLTAFSLLKYCYGLTDYKAQTHKLHYLRTKDGKEVDFALVHDQELIWSIEVKHKDKDISKHLKYFCNKYHVSGVQVVKELVSEYQQDEIQVRNLEDYLKGLAF